jgi:hypothetical protein
MNDSPSPAPIQYEALVAEFQDGLLNALRCHAASLEFLETWVPDEDPVRSILNMAESAEIAGCAEIAVQVRRDTLPNDRDDELLAALAALGDPVIRPDADTGGVVVTVTALGGLSSLQHVHPSLRAGVQRRLATINHEGAAPEGEGLVVRVAAPDGPVELAVSVDPETHFIRAARHKQSRDPVERALLDVLCAVIEGTPVDDAADHGPIRAMAALMEPGAPRPVPGILHPVNADPAFGPALRLAHRLRDEYRAGGGMAEDRNEFDPSPAAAWTAAEPAVRIARVADATVAFLTEIKRPAGTLAVLRIDDDLQGRPVRVIATFGPQTPAGDKPDLMRALERRLKRDVEGMLQLYHEQRKDENTIRRL